MLGDLLVQRLRRVPSDVIPVPNGFEPADTTALRPIPARPERNGTPLDLVMNGYWYGRNVPGVLLDALTRVGPVVAELTIVGGVSPTIAAQLRQAIEHPIAVGTARSRRALYERLHQADAAVVTMDTASAVESRIPAKVYDYLATGVPVIAVCPPSAALLHVPEARRFHYIHHQDTIGLATLLRRAMGDRAALRPGMPGEGPTLHHGEQARCLISHHLSHQLGELRFTTQWRERRVALVPAWAVRVGQAVAVRGETAGGSSGRGVKPHSLATLAGIRAGAPAAGGRPRSERRGLQVSPWPSGRIHHPST